MEDEERTEKLSVFNLLDKKVKILLIIVIFFWIYLVSSVQMVPNSQTLCEFYIEGDACNGNLTAKEDDNIYCCQAAVVYAAEDEVPKGTISWGIGWFFLILVALAFGMTLNDIGKPDHLSVEDAKKITERYLRKYYQGYKHTWDANKERFFLEKRIPYKWVIGVTLSKEDNTTYHAAEISSHWRSNKLLDNWIGFKTLDEPLTSSNIDKFITADIVYLPSFQLRKDKKVREEMPK